jgi:hypothetical protein
MIDLVCFLKSSPLIFISSNYIDRNRFKKLINFFKDRTLFDTRNEYFLFLCKEKEKHIKDFDITKIYQVSLRGKLIKKENNQSFNKKKIFFFKDIYLI